MARRLSFPVTHAVLSLGAFLTTGTCVVSVASNSGETVERDYVDGRVEDAKACGADIEEIERVSSGLGLSVEYALIGGDSACLARELSVPEGRVSGCVTGVDLEPDFTAFKVTADCE